MLFDAFDFPRDSQAGFLHHLVADGLLGLRGGVVADGLQLADLFGNLFCIFSLLPGYFLFFAAQFTEAAFKISLRIAVFVDQRIQVGFFLPQNFFMVADFHQFRFHFLFHFSAQGDFFFLDFQLGFLLQGFRFLFRFPNDFLAQHFGSFYLVIGEHLAQVITDGIPDVHRDR